LGQLARAAHTDNLPAVGFFTLLRRVEKVVRVTSVLPWRELTIAALLVTLAMMQTC
jgi:hypothetical protein